MKKAARVEDFERSHSFHSINTNSTHIYSAPDPKSPIIKTLFRNSKIFCDMSNMKDDFVKVNFEDGFVNVRHIQSTVEEQSNSFLVDVAKGYIGAPYKWGGRTILGMDCSGLVQTSLNATGYKCPRDSKQQCEVLGDPIDVDLNESHLQRGNIIFWQGHVGIYVGANKIIHSNMTSMDVRIENFMKIKERFEKDNNKIKSIARIVARFIDN